MPNLDEMLAAAGLLGTDSAGGDGVADGSSASVDAATQDGCQFRAGFVAIVGRPNAGKSTLTNALVGQKIAITANQPETTRKVIRGIVNLDAGQLVLVDTPGLHRPRTLLGERLNDMVHETLADVDAVVMCLPADEKIGPGDEFLLNLIKESHVPIVAVVTKADKITREALATKLMAVDQFADFAEIIPVSALKGRQIVDLSHMLCALMPASPALYPRTAVTDETEEDLMAEFIREAALDGVRDELPHSIAVTIDEIVAPTSPAEECRDGEDSSEPSQRSGVTKIHASLYVERDSQKGIIIGRKGTRLRDVGKKARRDIEKLLGAKVYLDLHVKVAKDWQRNPKLLGKLGF